MGGYPGYPGGLYIQSQVSFEEKGKGRFAADRREGNGILEAETGAGKEQRFL